MTPTTERLLKMTPAKIDDSIERARLYTMILFGLGFITDHEREMIMKRIKKVDSEICEHQERAYLG